MGQLWRPLASYCPGPLKDKEELRRCRAHRMPVIGAEIPEGDGGNSENDDGCHSEPPVSNIFTWPIDGDNGPIVPETISWGGRESLNNGVDGQKEAGMDCKSAGGDTQNFLWTQGRAIVLADLDAPRQLDLRVKQALLPIVAVVPHHQACSACSAGPIEFV